MSRALLLLLGREHDKKLAITLSELEGAATDRTIDAKLIGDILHQAHMVVRDMQLDSDITAKELYQALRVHDDVLSQDTVFVGLNIDGEIISLHPDDIATDTSESRQFSDRSLVHFRRALVEEIIHRYHPYVTRPRLIENFEKCVSKKEKP